MNLENTVRVYQQEPSYAEVYKNHTALSNFLLTELKQNLIQPGNKVVIKPNFVKESHLYKRSEWEYVITHPQIIKLVLENVIDALQDNGTIYIVDAPQTDSDFKKIIENTKLLEIINELQKKTKVKIHCYDLREERWHYKQGIIVKKETLKGDPKGYVTVNLGTASEFQNKKNKQYYGADYDMNETRKYHNELDNIYVMSKTILDCDVFINIPKLKTHKLGGITGCLKNLVGTCVIKNSIPHHTLGTPECGGDKFKHSTYKNATESKLKNIALNILKIKNPVINYPFILIKKAAGWILGSPQGETVRNGSWYGNDTIWRSVLDLNKILLYADKDGVMHTTPQRKYFALMDAIIAGEGNGPMEPDPKECGILISGFSPVAVDTVSAVLMGFDYHKIPSILKAYQINKYPLCNFDNAEYICIESNRKKWNKKISMIAKEDTFQFKAHFGWRGFIEMEE